MKVVLVAVNAKYIHSNPAVYCLYSYSEKEFGQDMEIAEYTINQKTDYIIKDLYLKKPDVVAFSCYIWNRAYITGIVRELKKVLPDTQMWAGGPEASYDATGMMKSLTQLSGIMVGEGEVTFNSLLKMWKYKTISPDKIDGIVYREENGHIKVNPAAQVMDLSDVPFPYKNAGDFENKIIYYESSRGCPFSCSYCLSSVDKKLRFRDLKLVREELQFFLDNRVKQVKFVDRTFNCRKDHALAIWRYIHEHDNGITNFHFEISADLMDEEELMLFKEFRPGLVQFEIGVQTTNARTIEEIHRKTDLKRLSYVVGRIRSYGNIHQHLDLIAGLPYEGYDSFCKSFNDVYCMMPDQLQLGFLKVLKGSYMYEKCKDYKMEYQSEPPYEVLYTDWLSFPEILKLKSVEEMVEVYYNTGQFRYTMKYMQKYFQSPFDMYSAIGCYYEENSLFGRNHSRLKRYEILYSFAAVRGGIDMEELKAVLMYDLYLRENLKSRPSFCKKPEAPEEILRQFRRKYRTEGANIHVEPFLYNPAALAEEGKAFRELYFVKFDYRRRNPLDNNALAEEVIWQSM